MCIVWLFYYVKFYFKVPVNYILILFDFMENSVRIISPQGRKIFMFIWCTPIDKLMNLV